MKGCIPARGAAFFVIGVNQAFLRGLVSGLYCIYKSLKPNTLLL